jgi:hypothetical protein
MSGHRATSATAPAHPQGPPIIGRARLQPGQKQASSAGAHRSALSAAEGRSEAAGEALSEVEWAKLPSFAPPHPASGCYPQANACLTTKTSSTTATTSKSSATTSPTSPPTSSTSTHPATPARFTITTCPRRTPLEFNALLHHLMGTRFPDARAKQLTARMRVALRFGITAIPMRLSGETARNPSAFRGITAILA